VKIPRLNNREQLLIALSIVVIVGGGYGVFRFWPTNQAIAAMQKSAEATQSRLLKARIPDEPVEDADKLIEQLEDRERAIELVRAQFEALETRLAPFDSQEMIVSISQLARNSQVRIRVNEALKVPAKRVGVVSKKNNKKNRKSRTVESKQTTPVILPETSSWIDRMSPGTMFHRPIQRIELEGSFVSIRKFIHGLDKLPYQVTVLRLKIEKLPTLAPTGYPQTLVCELVLAL